MGNEFVDDFVQRFQNFYYFFEDKWYDVLDKIDSKIPVYPIVDKVDNVIPSFILFLLITIFLIILISYAIQFSSPFEITFTTVDSKTKAFLSGVSITGNLNKQELNIITNSTGTAVSEVKSSGKNVYAMFGEMLFGKKEDFNGSITASKTGYQTQNSNLEAGTLEKRILLEPNAVPNPEPVPGWAKVIIVDASTKQTIIENTAFIKFECGNKSIPLKTVKDDSDGSMNGEFYLSESSCDFVVREAYAPGYVKKSNATNVQKESTVTIELEKLREDPKGEARIFVSEKGSDKNKPLAGIIINLTGNNQTESIITFTNGIASKELETGTYTITINDSNYYPITPEDNKKIVIEEDEESYLEIELEFIPEELKRKIFVKIIDANGPVNQAEVNFFRTIKNNKNALVSFDEDGTMFPPINTNNRTDINGLLEVKSGPITVSDVEKIIGVVKKQGYNTKVFVPKIVDYNTSYETISIDKTTLANSANAIISTTVGESNALVQGIKTSLYQEIVVNNKQFVGLIETKDTNSGGKSAFNGLYNGFFFGTAKHNKIILTSDVNRIDLGQTHTFDFHFDTNVSKITIKLFDFDTKQIIETQNKAVIKVFEVKNDDSTEFIENMAFSENKFSSKYLNINKTHFVDIILDDYDPNYLLIDSGWLRLGENLFNVELTKIIDNNTSECSTNADCNSGEICLLNENHKYQCVKVFDDLDECNTSNDCDFGEVCLLNDNLVNVCVTPPSDCNSNTYSFISNNELECTEECDVNKTLIQPPNLPFFICYNFDLGNEECKTNTYKINENNLVQCINQNECKSPYSLTNIGKDKNNINIFICRITESSVCETNSFVQIDGKLVCSDECDGEWARIDNIFVCYPKDFDSNPKGTMRILYNNIFSKHSDAFENKNAIKFIEGGKEYWNSFRVILNNDEDSFKKLLAMTKTNSENINNFISDLPEIVTNSNSFSCALNNLDGIYLRDENNYYFPVSQPCQSTPKIRTGFSWEKDFLSSQTYTFFTREKVINNDLNKFILQFRSQEQNSLGLSETILSKKELPINKYFGDNVFGVIKIGNTTLNLDFVSSIKNASINFDDEQNIELTIFNESNGLITNGKISLFSYTGNGRNDFRESNSNPTGNLLINDKNSFVINSDFNINSGKEKMFNTTIKSTSRQESNDQLVIVLEYIEFNGDSKRFVDVINIKTNAHQEFKLKLNNIEFLADVPDQEISGKISSGTRLPKIKNVLIKVDVNCDGRIEDEYKFDNTDTNHISNNEFNYMIPGTFKYNKDCILVSVYSDRDEHVYSPIIDEKIYAQYHGATDPSLACVDIYYNTGEKHASLEWGANIELIVKNNCNNDIKYRLNTGLECKIKNSNEQCYSQAGFALKSNEEARVIITGKNIDFKENDFPNFSDRLGYFPVYAQAKFADSRKNFVNADDFSISLINILQCFELSNNQFNLMTETEVDFFIKNHCQFYFEDYSLPSTKIDSMSYNIIQKTNANQGQNNQTLQQIRFKVNARLGGISYNQRIVSVPVITQLGSQSIGKTELVQVQHCVNDANFCDYNSLIINFNDIDGLPDPWTTTQIDFILNDSGITNADIGFKLINNVILTFVDNTTKIINLNELSNASLEPFNCREHINQGCSYSRTNAVTDNGDGHSVSFNIPLNKIGENKQVKQIEFSLYGNKNVDEAYILVTPTKKYFQEQTIFDMSAPNENDISIELGEFTIPSISNIYFSLTSLENIMEKIPTNLNNVNLALLTNNDTIEVWVEKDKLMAKYLGPKPTNTPTGQIDLTLTKKGGIIVRDTQFGIINIKDYVNIGKANSNSPKRQISGIQ